MSIFKDILHYGEHTVAFFEDPQSDVVIGSIVSINHFDENVDVINNNINNFCNLYSILAFPWFPIAYGETVSDAYTKLNEKMNTIMNEEGYDLSAYVYALNYCLSYLTNNSDEFFFEQWMNNYRLFEENI